MRYELKQGTSGYFNPFSIIFEIETLEEAKELIKRFNKDAKNIDCKDTILKELAKSIETEIENQGFTSF